MKINKSMCLSRCPAPRPCCVRSQRHCRRFTLSQLVNMLVGLSALLWPLLLLLLLFVCVLIFFCGFACAGFRRHYSTVYCMQDFMSLHIVIFCANKAIDYIAMEHQSGQDAGRTWQRIRTYMCMY